ncbi:putative lipase [Xylaria palmicola]|nr:putative lipase [Xylaria palmicola]
MFSLRIARTTAAVILLLLALAHDQADASPPLHNRDSSSSGVPPTVFDHAHNITYMGLERNGIEIFLNIPYAQDTSGVNRFRPPRPATFPPSGTLVNALEYGPACPQFLRDSVNPTELSTISRISEDCLNLNVARPKGLGPVSGTNASALLPVMVYIHGGSYFVGWNGDLSIAPDGLVRQAEENGTPIIHVAMNYRLGVFGFAQSAALRAEGSENAGLRDQRLALKWAQDNIKHFGGDPNRVTIFGQSSGGVSVSMHLLAYGGSQPAYFQQAICQSQAVALGTTANFTHDAMAAVIEATGCNTTEFDSAETVACLRGLNTSAVTAAELDTWQYDNAHNGGDVWLPTVDGDYLPAPPSQLLREGRFVSVPDTVRSVMMGWTDDDTGQFVDAAIATAEDTRNAIAEFVAAISPASLDALLALYPVTDFAADPAANRSAEFYRVARMMRDMMMVCVPIEMGAAFTKKAAAAARGANSGFHFYLYDWNQTVLDDALQAQGVTGLGAVHTSEFAYIFANVDRYDVEGFGYAGRVEDFALAQRASRSWAAFAYTGRPGTTTINIKDDTRGLGEDDDDIFQSFEPAFSSDGELRGVYVVGGPNPGWGRVESDDVGRASSPWEISAQKLKQRCELLNSDELVQALRYRK